MNNPCWVFLSSLITIQFWRNFDKSSASKITRTTTTTTKSFLRSLTHYMLAIKKLPAYKKKWLTCQPAPRGSKMLHTLDSKMALLYGLLFWNAAWIQVTSSYFVVHEKKALKLIYLVICNYSHWAVAVGLANPPRFCKRVSSALPHEWINGLNTSGEAFKGASIVF